MIGLRFSKSSSIVRLLFASIFISITASSIVGVSSADAFCSDGLNASDWPLSTAITQTIFLPFMSRAATCQPIPGESYAALSVLQAGDGRAAEVHPDKNLAVRGYITTTGTLDLVYYDHPVDSNGLPPQLFTLFGDQRTPAFSHVYQVYDWDWANNRRGAAIGDPPVTLLGMTVTQGEILRVPSSGYDIGLQLSGYEVMVLYAAQNRITLIYTRNDSVATGYAVHLENICVEPNLLALYQSMNVAGRTRLPALFAGQSIGRAINTEIDVAIRDTGSFMDPRSRTDWWQGR